MVESSDEPSLLDRIRSSSRIAHASYNPFRAGDQRPAIPITNTPRPHDAGVSLGSTAAAGPKDDVSSSASHTTDHCVADIPASFLPPPAPPPPENGDGETSSAIVPEEAEEEPNIAIRFYQSSKEILLSSWLNVLLVFVPVGIAVQASGVNKTIVFALNAIAIVPLAGLLSHATESVASEMGDTIGALMNITFGNAVELIIL